MKKLILTILTTITIFGVNAQGNNLQFNRALFERYDITCTGNFNNEPFYKSNTFTIPTNKVWKIHRSSIVKRAYNSSSNSLDFGGLVSISLANENKFFLMTTTNSGSYSEEQNSNIIWLPSGTYDMKVKVPNAGTYDIIFNGIEFNIVP